MAGKRPGLPPREVCALCGFDDAVAIIDQPGEGRWRYRCDHVGKYHQAPYEWSVLYPSGAVERNGVFEALGLYDDLPSCLVGGEGWIEHGVVEYRYKVLRPGIYSKLISDYGHRELVHKPYTTSVVIAGVLARLRDEGAVGYRSGLPATGLWKDNGSVGYWAPVATPLDAVHTTWAAWAADHGIAPDFPGMPVPHSAAPGKR